MLTNKNISVLIILISFSFTSCWITDVNNSDENVKIEKIGGEWKKGKSIWGGIDLDNNKDTLIYSWSTELPKWEPKDIK